MEELLESICDSELMEFMREAYLSYMAGAYKSSIIVSTVAVYEDLRRKTKQLSLINSDARDITIEVERRISNNEVFESYLEDQLTSKKILNALDKRNLTALRDRRNLSAHPTGHKATAEEARYIFSIAINNFLSKPLLYANEKVDYILTSLRNENFFPSLDIGNIAFIVKRETENLHEGVYPYLLRKLAEDLEEKNSTKNTRFFLYGLAHNSKSVNFLEDALIKYFIKLKADDSIAEKAIMTSIGINANLFFKSDEVTQTRLRYFIKNLISTGGEDDFAYLYHPIYFFELAVEIKGANILVTEFNDEINELIRLYIYNTRIVMLSFHNTLHKNELIDKLCLNASSSTFDISNKFSNRVKDLDELLSKNVDGKSLLKIIISLLRGADWGAWVSIDFKNRKFYEIPKCKDVIKIWLQQNNTEGIEIINEYDNSIATVEIFVDIYL